MGGEKRGKKLFNEHRLNVRCYFSLNNVTIFNLFRNFFINVKKIEEKDDILEINIRSNQTVWKEIFRIIRMY